MVEASAPAPIATVYGQPLHEVPRDLYIPPDALEVFLEQFQGPLDLLLYLIRKENINVLDIPMAALTAQYLEYVVPGILVMAMAGAVQATAISVAPCANAERAERISTSTVARS